MRQAVASARPEAMERRPGYGGWWRLSSARPRHGAPRGKRPRTVPRLRPDGGRHAARGVARGADRVRRGRVPEPVRRTAGSLARAAGRACGGPAGPRRLGRCVLHPPRPRPAPADLLSAGGRGRHADLDRRAAHAGGGWTGPLLAHRFRPAETSGPPAFRHDARQRRAGRGAAARRGRGRAAFPDRGRRAGRTAAATGPGGGDRGRGAFRRPAARQRGRRVGPRALRRRLALGYRSRPGRPRRADPGRHARSGAASDGGHEERSAPGRRAHAGAADARTPLRLRRLFPRRAARRRGGGLRRGRAAGLRVPCLLPRRDAAPRHRGASVRPGVPAHRLHGRPRREALRGVAAAGPGIWRRSSGARESSSASPR